MSRENRYFPNAGSKIGSLSPS